MGLPFVVIEGVVLLADQAGTLADIKPSLAGKNRIASEAVLAGGQPPYYLADVVLKDGLRRLVTDATVTVEQIFGFDDFADVWTTEIQSGSINDTIRIQIAAFNDPTGNERDIPAVDVTTTITASEAGDEIALRDKIISDLNSNTNFALAWKATSIKDNAIIHISSKFIGEYGERLITDDFFITVTSPGADTIVGRAYDTIKRRGKQNTGARDPRDKRLVTVGVSGEVTTTPGEVDKLYIEKAVYLGSSDLRVVGTPLVPVTFSIPLSNTNDVLIQELRFFGGGAGIKFGQFLSKNSPLSYGICVNIKSDDKMLSLPLIKATEDFKNEFSFGTAANFTLLVGAGIDQFLAVLRFETPFPLRKIGTFSIDDYIHVCVHNDLSAGLSQLEFMAIGFEREV